MDALGQIKEVYRNNYKEHPSPSVSKAFEDVHRLFSGKMEGFNPCDTGYHNIRHTLETVVVMVQILDGYNRSGSLPLISKKFFELGIISALLHDVGYIRRLGDHGGTGAKYTFKHVKRSVEFAKHYLSSEGYNRNSISSVQNMIWCTCSQKDLPRIRFSSKEEEITSYCLGTSDILAQMSTHDYLKRLHALFDEFREAYEYEGIEQVRKKGHRVFQSSQELIANTPIFYENWVKTRFEDMGSVYRFIRFHFGDGRNPYVESIKVNLHKISVIDH